MNLACTSLWSTGFGDSQMVGTASDSVAVSMGEVIVDYQQEVHL